MPCISCGAFPHLSDHGDLLGLRDGSDCSGSVGRGPVPGAASRRQSSNICRRSRRLCGPCRPCADAGTGHHRRTSCFRAYNSIRFLGSAGKCREVVHGLIPDGRRKRRLGEGSFTCRGGRERPEAHATGLPAGSFGFSWQHEDGENARGRTSYEVPARGLAIKQTARRLSGTFGRCRLVVRWATTVRRFSGPMVT